MNRDEITQNFLTFTAAIFGLAALTGVLLVCASKCFRHTSLRRRKPKQHKLNADGQSSSKNPLIYCSKSGAISIDCPEMDYIDSSRNADLIASTVQVKSLHSSPIANNV